MKASTSLSLLYYLLHLRGIECFIFVWLQSVGGESDVSGGVSAAAMLVLVSNAILVDIDTYFSLL